jgi:hypothetical protein
VQTLSTITVEGDGWISEDIVDEVVHSGFGELAALSADARETAWALDFLIEELVDICASES